MTNTLPHLHTPTSAALWGAFLTGHGMASRGTKPAQGDAGSCAHAQGARAIYSVKGPLPAIITKAMKAMVKAGNADNADPAAWACYKYTDHGETFVLVRV